MSAPSTPSAATRPNPPQPPPLSIPTATSSTQTTIPTPPPAPQPPVVSTSTAPPSPNPPQIPSPPQTTSTTPTQTTHSNPRLAPHSPRAATPRAPASDAVLPRGTTVRIAGNNRTKWDLIGRSGSVRTAQTLGGWHEVQLDDGGLVRVQRNALAVIQYPADQPPLSTLPRLERRDHHDDRPIHHPPALQTAVLKKRSKKTPKLVRHEQQQQQHKPLPPPYANISRLNESSLRKYRSFYNLNIPVDCPRDELISAVGRHFEKTKVNENEVITKFLRHIARRTGPAASD